MPKFSDRSTAKLETCHQDLQILFSYVIKYFDCTVTHGQRTPDYQFELYKKGREYNSALGSEGDRNSWMKIKKGSKGYGTVTNCDGFKIKSRHNATPLSDAVDVCPYPTLYSDVDTIRYFSGMVMGIAKMLKAYGTIDHDIICGIDWDNDNDLNDQKLFDAVHFQIK